MAPQSSEVAVGDTLLTLCLLCRHSAKERVVLTLQGWRLRLINHYIRINGKDKKTNLVTNETKMKAQDVQ